MVVTRRIDSPTFWQRRGSPAVSRLYHRVFRQLNREAVAEEVWRKAKELQPNQKIMLLALLITHKLIQPQFLNLDPEDLRSYHFRKLLSRDQINNFNIDFDYYIGGQLNRVAYEVTPSEIIVAGGESKEIKVSDNLAAVTMRRKKVNGDALAIIKPAYGKGILIVADGIGGHAHPEKESMVAVHALSLLTRRGIGLEEAFKKVTELNLMTTLVAAEINDGNKLRVYHFGDSRAFLIKKSGSIVLLTEDHSGTIERYRLQDPSAAWPLENPGGFYDFSRRLNENILRGPHRKTEEITLEEGDRLLLCTDGLYRLLDWEGFKALFTLPQPVREIVAALIRILQQSMVDDTTAVLFEYHANQD